MFYFAPQQLWYLVYQTGDNAAYSTTTDIGNPQSWSAPRYFYSSMPQIAGSDTYVLLIEAIGSDGRRYFRSWTAPAIGGPWTALADTQTNPFARANNVTFDGTAWTQDISHGELIRSGADQTLTIDSCDLRFLYQGKDPNANDPYNLLPWRLGLLTQTNSTC